MTKRKLRPRDRRDTVEIVSRAEFEEQQQQYSLKSKDPVTLLEPLKVSIVRPSAIVLSCLVSSCLLLSSLIYFKYML